MELFAPLANEAMEISQGQTDIPTAVARLIQFVPPARARPRR
jgi:hypothetical protein